MKQQSILQEQASRSRVLDVLGRQRHWIALAYLAVALSFTFSLAFDFSFAFAGVDLLVWLLTGYNTSEEVTFEFDRDFLVASSIYEEILMLAVILVLTLWGAAQSLHIVGMVLDHRIARRELIERQSAGSLRELGN